MNKVYHFNRTELEKYLKNPKTSPFVHNMKDIYQNVADHLVACRVIVRDIFGDDYNDETIFMVHKMVLDFMEGLPQDEMDITFEPEESVGE